MPNRPEVQVPMPTFNWPLDPAGNPMALVTMGAAELIGLPNYSNVTLSASITRFVVDEEEDVALGLRSAVKSCEEVIAEERQMVLDVVKGSK